MNREYYDLLLVDKNEGCHFIIPVARSKLEIDFLPHLLSFENISENDNMYRIRINEPNGKQQQFFEISVSITPGKLPDSSDDLQESTLRILRGFLMCRNLILVGKKEEEVKFSGEKLTKEQVDKLLNKHKLSKDLFHNDIEVEFYFKDELEYELICVDANDNTKWYAFLYDLDLFAKIEG